MEITRKNTKMWSRMGPRAVYGLVMLDLVKRNEKVYALSGDLGNSSGLSRLISEYPDRYFNVGIAEQNLLGVSAGLAKEGLVPFASSFAPFITHRCEDQIRMNMGYMHLNIKTVGLGSGISMSILGNSHYGMTDLSVLAATPGVVILSPCDCAELVMSVEAAARYVGPVYIRMTGEPGMPKIYEESFNFQIGRANKLRSGRDILILATGSMVYRALEAATSLEEHGIEAEVYDMHTIRPLDTSVFSNLVGLKSIVTIEEHSIIGGLGSLVNNHLVKLRDHPPVLNIGLPDAYVKAGSYSYMLDQCGLTAGEIANRIDRFMKKD